METSKAGLNLMFPPEWVRSCWGSCPGAAGEGPGEGAGGSAGAAEPAVRPAPEAAVERRLGPGPAVRGPWHQDGDPELGRRAAASPAAQQVCQTDKCEFNCTASLFTDLQRTTFYFTFVFSAFLVLNGHSRDFTITYSWKIHKRQI